MRLSIGCMTLLMVSVMEVSNRGLPQNSQQVPILILITKNYTKNVIPAQAGIQCANESDNSFMKNREYTIQSAFLKDFMYR